MLLPIASLLLLLSLTLTTILFGLTFSPGSSMQGNQLTQLLLILLIFLELGGMVLLFLLRKQWNSSVVAANGFDPEQVAHQQKDWERQLEAEAARIDQQSRKLAERYRAINEWMDYPQILDLQSGSALPGQLEDSGSGRSVVQTEKLVQQDRAVREILDSQAEVIYEKIRRNEYSPQGKFQPFLLRDDLHVTALKIAHVYQPELENPLLSTSPEQIARALNRIGLHLLVVMDQLPLDLKSYNIQKTYDTIRHAITTYGAYKKASPYLDWASKGIYFGRMVTSTNPIALGLLWGATELGKYGAQKLATHLIDRQAIGLLQSVIRVVGYEVAAIYGGDFRYRDPNWCYAVELTHLLASFPASRESLQYGFLEVGRLQLRNEYDRLAVYRCLSSGKVIDRKQTHPDLLTEQERRQIIELLEKAYRDVLHGQAAAQVEKWKKGVQNHLGLQLSLKTQTQLPSHKESKQLLQNRQMMTFLIGFLTRIKAVPLDKLEQYFRLFDQPGETLPGGSREQLAEITQTLQETDKERFFDFLPPDIDPKDDRIQLFLKVLCRLNALIPPFAPEMEQLILETGFYYRRTLEQTTSLIFDAYRETALQQAPQLTSALKEFDPSLARDLLYLQQETVIELQQVSFIYRQVKIQHPAEAAAKTSASAAHYLLAEGNGLKLIRSLGIDHFPELVWQADDSARLENKSTLIVAEAQISGGHFFSPEQTGAVIRIQAPMTARYQQFFGPLISRISG